MAGTGPLPSDWRQHYDALMADATSRYADVIDALHDAGIPAEMIQTGGMCLAITWVTPGGYYLLTDREGPLSWDRDPDNGWALGRYADDECSEPVGEVLEHHDQTPATAVQLATGGSQ